MANMIVTVKAKNLHFQYKPGVAQDGDGTL